jgi:hypothetical protein
MTICERRLTAGAALLVAWFGAAGCTVSGLEGGSHADASAPGGATDGGGSAGASGSAANGGKGGTSGSGGSATGGSSGAAGGNATGGSGGSSGSAGASGSGGTGVEACAPKTCGELGYHCGSASDGCGGTLDCGPCSGDEACVSHSCEQAVLAACGSCPTGYSLKYQAYNNACTSGSCGNAFQSVCLLDGVTAIGGCALTCLSGQHRAATVVPNCTCGANGQLSMCLPDE